MAAEPRFVAKPGQVDYTDIRYCPVVDTIVVCGGKVLMQQRSHGMRLYPGVWSVISGFLDTNESVEDKAYEEILEEAGIEAEDVISMRRFPVVVHEAPEYNKTWIVFPVLAEVADVPVKHNWEAENLQWLSRSEIDSLDLLPGIKDVLNIVLQ